MVKVYNNSNFRISLNPIKKKLLYFTNRLSICNYFITIYEIINLNAYIIYKHNICSNSKHWEDIQLFINNMKHGISMIIEQQCITTTLFQ